MASQTRFEWPEQKSFEAYHAENPQIYTLLRRFAFEARAAGRTRIGIKMLYERVRWFSTVEAKNDSFKLNNNYHAAYARLLMENEPYLDGMFETRRSKADE